MADVDISMNLNTFNFWTAEYEYIKKTEKRIHFVRKGGALIGGGALNGEFMVYRIQTQLPGGRYGPRPNNRKSYLKLNVYLFVAKALWLMILPEPCCTVGN